jgi:hypothetical protein
VWFFRSKAFEAPRVDIAIERRALEMAQAEIGCGEVTNNRGPDIDRYRSGDGTGKGPGGAGAWCSVFCAYVLLAAVESLNAEGHDFALPFKTSRGAKRLVKNMGLAGSFVDVSYSPLLIRPGSLIAWHRLGADGVVTWRGHVGMVVRYCPETDELVTIEGNKSTKRGRLANVAEFRYPNGRWRKRLFRIATLVATSDVSTSG